MAVLFSRSSHDHRRKQSPHPIHLRGSITPRSRTVHRGDGRRFRLAHHRHDRLVQATMSARPTCVSACSSRFTRSSPRPRALCRRGILADGDHVVVECKGDAATVTGERYANTYCFVIRLADGRLKELDRIHGHRVGRARAQAAGRLDIFSIEHDLFGKPLHTFPDHARAFTRRCGVTAGRSPFAIHSS